MRARPKLFALVLAAGDSLLIPTRQRLPEQKAHDESIDSAIGQALACRIDIAAETVEAIHKAMRAARVTPPPPTPRPTTGKAGYDNGKPGK